MKQSEAKVRIEKLRKEIEEHNHRYYVLNQPLISDFEYDILLNQLDTLEKKFPEFIIEGSPTRRVGSDITKEFEQFEHRYPMLSLGNTYSEEELDLFKNTLMRGLYPYLKYDGTTYKYIFTIWSGYPLDGGLSRVWAERDYYSNLSGYISTNKNIINNPGW